MQDHRSMPAMPAGHFTWAERLISCCLLLLAIGCVPLPKSTPKADVRSFGQETNVIGSITPTALQSKVMRYADEYSMVVAQAAEDFAAKVGTPEARHVAARIKLGQASAAVIDATGKSPVVNALDLVVLASASRMVAEDYLVGERFGEAARPLLDVSRQMETNAWTLIRQVLKEEQQQELRDLIQVWREKNPNQRYVGAVRFREFAEVAEDVRQRTFKPNSVLSLLFLDPMAGLDPTLRAVEEARYLAERALYYGQRLPILLSWQAEFLSLQLADQPAAQQMLTNANQVSTSLEAFGKVANQLPALVNQQREAAIQQIFAGVAVERSNLVASLASEDARLRGLLAETRSTIEAASQMANSVNAAVQSLESFMRYVSPPKTNLVATERSTNSRPFDVLDYGTAANQIGAMARDINVLLTSINQSTPQASQLGAQAADRVERALWKGFWAGLLLIVLLLGGAVLAALLYRRLAHRIAPPGRKPLSGPS